jgi:hypothetical protein
MRTLYALAFVCMSIQASAFDLGALSDPYAIESRDHTAAVPGAIIADYDETIDASLDFGLLGDDSPDTTGSIAETTLPEHFFVY